MKDARIKVMQVSTILPFRNLVTATAATVTRPARRAGLGRSDYAVHGVKNLLAALLAWGVVAPWSPGNRPHLAVATALIMTNAPTVYRSVTKAAQNVFARSAGLTLALATARLMGSTTGSVVAIAVIAVVIGPRRALDDRLQIASTAVIALAATTASPADGLVTPAAQSLTGAVVGIVVNALVLPPLYLDESDSAVRSLARAMGTLLREMGAGLAERQLAASAHTWLHQARDLEKNLVNAEEQVRQAAESLRWNTRRTAHARRKDVPYGEGFRTLRGVFLQVRGIARTLSDNAHDDHTDHHLGQQFLDQYAETLKLAGTAVEEFAGPRAASATPESAPRERLRGALDGALTWHEAMTDLIGRGTLTKPGAWHIYGSLMTDVERLLLDLDQGLYGDRRNSRAGSGS